MCTNHEPKTECKHREHQTHQSFHRPDTVAQTVATCCCGVQKSAGNVGGFNKKWVSLCAQNQLKVSFYADCTAQNE